MNAQRRAKQKYNRASSGRHTGAAHVPGERCTVCRPLPRTHTEFRPVDTVGRMTMNRLDVMARESTERRLGMSPQRLNVAAMLAGLTKLTRTQPGTIRRRRGGRRRG